MLVPSEQPCPGRRDGRYEILAKRAVAGDLGGVGSVVVRYETARALFPYKWDALLPLPDDNDRNRDSSIPKFTPFESGKLGLDLLSRRLWHVDDNLEPSMRSIRAKTCLKRFVPGNNGGVDLPFCIECHKLDKNEGLKRQLRRVRIFGILSAHRGADDLPGCGTRARRCEAY